ncbi:MAG: GNAT family N-acetyltransferase [Betaproteobacteria bacterium]|nr:GNAT family N-acetyltransferase [Betaproteobacteria bacterium]
MIQASPYILRPYTSADAPVMSAAVRESTASVGHWMSWAKPNFSDYDALCWFEHCNHARVTGEAHEFGIFTVDGEFVGGCGLNQFSKINKLCNLGYWVRQSRQRTGAATAATLALRDLAFASLGLARVEIVVAEGNDASVAVARKVGAVHECVAQNRLQLHGKATAAHVFSFAHNTKPAPL